MNENITIHKAYVISPNLSRKCHELYNICLQNDNNIQTLFFSELNNSLHPLIYYAATDNQLIGFISVDYFENLYAELCGFILPEFRNKKIMSRLFDTVLDDYDNYSISISLNSNNQQALQMISHFGFEYRSTEYCMTLNLTNLCFKKLPLNIKSIRTDNNEQFSLYKDNILRGSCFVTQINSSTVCIHDVYVDEFSRRKGYGYELMSAILCYLCSQYKYALLHVTKENIPATILYKKLGFIITDSTSVYEI